MKLERFVQNVCDITVEGYAENENYLIYESLIAVFKSRTATSIGDIVIHGITSKTLFY